MSKIYEVYVCRLGDEVMYVGQGEKGRHKHCNSGISHVYELNRLHFLGNRFVVDVVEYTKSKKEALEVELKLIRELEPKLNVKMGNFVGSNMANKVASAKAAIIKYGNEALHLKGIDRVSYFDLVDEFFSVHKGGSIVSGGEKMLSASKYKKLGYRYLYLLRRYICENQKHRDGYYCKVFAEAFSSVIGTDLNVWGKVVSKATKVDNPVTLLS